MRQWLLLIAVFGSACASTPPAHGRYTRFDINLATFHDEDRVCDGQPTLAHCATVREVLRFLGSGRAEP